MTIHEIRDAYLGFFQERNHKVIPSASLLPDNDPTTLFTGSGMQPMVPFLLGEAHPMGKRITDSQKCFRAQDIEEVGDNRHTTFFEMLGNWSLGDYFKQDQLVWVYEFLTKTIGLDPTNLYVTVFAGNDQIPRDDESIAVWTKIFSEAGFDPAEKIFEYDESKNWWSRAGVPANMPVGEPGGPDSELFWDFGADLGLHEQSEWANELCHVNCDCGRYLEIGNSVFMEYQKTGDGFGALPQQNVDFGGGLERIAAALNGDPDVFKIDAFDGMRSVIEQRSGKMYGADETETYAFRVLFDHLRASVFLIADGAEPSNKDQGYFSRRLIRRAVRFASQLGITEAITSDVGRAVIETYAGAYPMLVTDQDRILSALGAEEEKFRKTLVKGEREFVKLFDAKGAISGDDAFVLYSTYGFPLELTEEMAAEKGQKIDRETFKTEFEKHRDLSRAGAQQKFAGGLADHSEATVALHTATHMLHQALRQVLGDHVVQKGSNITPERLRFDFSHPEKMTPEQIAEVEQLVNTAIEQDLPVHFEILDIEEAKSRGAIGVFDDKYAQLGGKIKVYFIGDNMTGEYYSKEVCGGPHVERTGTMGHFRIKKEQSSSSGIRRIKAVLE